MSRVQNHKAAGAVSMSVPYGAPPTRAGSSRLLSDRRRPASDARVQSGVVSLDVRVPQPDNGEAHVTVIIPFAPDEPEPSGVLAVLPPTFEVILARGGTRASSMNAAASIAKGRHLWFVHADTILETDSITKLIGKIGMQDRALFYFDLRFDGGGLMRLTDLGVRFRSRMFGIPFGDQALCLRASTFRALGGYDETAAYGEDHLLVRRARRAGVPVLPVGATIGTSARKYRDTGWLRTTSEHWRLTLLQILRDR